MKNLIMLCVMILLLSFTVAIGCDKTGFIGTGQKDTNFTIVIACPTCTFINFTLTSPSKVIVLDNVQMTQDGNNFEYIVLASNITEQGTYFGNGGDDVSPLGFCFDITTTGYGNTINESILYLSSIVFIMFIILMLLLVSTMLPSNDKQDEEGRILQVSYLKHLRPTIYGVCYSLVVAITFIIYNLTLAYSNHDMLATFTFMIYQVMFWSMIVILPVWFLWIVVRIFEDKEFKNLIERGVDLPGRF